MNQMCGWLNCRPSFNNYYGITGMLQAWFLRQQGEAAIIPVFVPFPMFKLFYISLFLCFSIVMYILPYFFHGCILYLRAWWYRCRTSLVCIKKIISTFFHHRCYSYMFHNLISGLIVSFLLTCASM